MRTLIRNVRIVQPSGVRRGHILIQDERIEGFLESTEDITADTTIDGREAYALPGLIEVHGHMRVPGLTHKEDYETGTAAAAAGGYTTFLDMPNTKPPTTTIDRLYEKADLARGACHIDYGFIFGGTVDNQNELEIVPTDAIVGVKFFTAGHETTPTTVTDLGTLYRSLKILAKRRLLPLIHAENQSLINILTMEARESGRDDLSSYCEARGELVVATEVWCLMKLLQAVGGRMYICHVSTEGELEALGWARKNRLAVISEVAVYHLVYNRDNAMTLGNLAKVSPALRRTEEQEVLWRALMDNEIAVVASEHTPHTLIEKEGTIWQAASGMPGIQEALPQMITNFSLRYPNVSDDERMRRIAVWMSTNPAQVFSLKGKGALLAGYDADLVLVDPHSPWHVQRSDLFTKCGWSAAENSTLFGRPSHTFVRGTLVYEDGRIVSPLKGRPITIDKNLSN